MLTFTKPMRKGMSYYLVVNIVKPLLPPGHGDKVPGMTHF